uniref:F-box domain-containing protein n=1 Tax=Aegilops tauschii TaxID=37682 RepID=M8CPL5_AEGTA
MEDLPEALVTEILKRITRISDLNYLSLVSKQLYKIEGNQRGAIRVGSGLCTATEALTSLCARFTNLQKLEIDYSGWIPEHGNQLDNKGLFVFSSHCSSLIDLTLSFCSYIDDSGLGCLVHCKKLVSLRLNSAPKITSYGHLSVAVGCTSLSALHLIDCEKIDSVEWDSMDDLPEAVVTEIVKKITRTSDLNSIFLVSKGLYTIEGSQRGVLSALVLVFALLQSINITVCQKLVSPRLNSTPQITSIGLFSVAVGCTSLSALHLIDCEKIDSVEWLEYLGSHGSLEELVVKNCKGINHHDFLKFGSGWMKLQKFEFERKRVIYDFSLGCEYSDPSYNAHSMDIYDFCCESLKNLRLAHIKTWPEIGLRVVLGKCKALENLWLEYVYALNDNDMIALFRSCSNLKSISVGLNLQRYCSEDGYCETRTSFTDNSIYALALNYPMLQIVDLKFTGCSRDWPSEIGFTKKGFLALIQSCPIRVLVLNTANFFDDEGMKALSSSPHLETLELILCHAVTDAGMRFIAHTPCLSNLTLRACHNVTDVGMAELGRAHKLGSLVIEYCGEVSLQAAQGVAKSVHYSEDFPDSLMKAIGLGA